MCCSFNCQAAFPIKGKKMIQLKILSNKTVIVKRKIWIITCVLASLSLG